MGYTPTDKHKAAGDDIRTHYAAQDACQQTPHKGILEEGIFKNPHLSSIRVHLLSGRGHLFPLISNCGSIPWRPTVAWSEVPRGRVQPHRR